MVTFGYGCAGGWDPFGPQRIVTRSNGHQLFELDGEPVLDLYRRYLGEEAANLPASGLRFPLCLRAYPDSPEVIVRTITAVDQQTRSMSFAGDIPQGAVAQLMRGTF